MITHPVIEATTQRLGTNHTHLLCMAQMANRKGPQITLGAFDGRGNELPGRSAASLLLADGVPVKV